MTRYEFRAADGSICCSTTNPRHLCAACEAKAQATGPRAAASAQPAVEFRNVETGETFMSRNLRHLCSPMQELRDSIPAQFRSEMDWAKFFAASAAAPVIPDGYLNAIEVRNATVVRAVTPLVTGHTGCRDGYGENLRPVVAAVDPLDGYAVALNHRATVHQFPAANTDGYLAAIARRKES